MVKLCYLVGVLLSLCSRVSAAAVPTFQSGDIIFQTSGSNQSYAIMWASKSLYSHVGIIEEDGGKFYVIEAISKVSRTPLEKWIARGRLGRYTVVRPLRLEPADKNKLVQAAKSYLGRPYDVYFTSLNREIYCSELVWLAFRAVGIKIGELQKVDTLDVDNYLTRKLFRNRWRRHPLCSGKFKQFDPCWKKILTDQLVTPVSLSEDKHVKTVYSNYP